MAYEKIRNTAKWTKLEISNAVVNSKSYKEILKKLGVPYCRYWHLVLRELLEQYEINFKSYYRRGKPASELLKSREKGAKKYRVKQSYKRKNNIETWKFIWEDSRNSDKKKGLHNNLTKDFIRDLISQPCSYCSEHSIRMTLDRVNNSKGHTTDNVVQACIRCNYIRGNMPIDAWLCLKPGLKKARKEGFFGNWIGKMQKEDNR